MVQLNRIGQGMNPRQQSSAAQAIDGIAIGEAGPAGTPLEDFILGGGDDYNELPTFWNPGNNRSGQYAAAKVLKGWKHVGDPVTGKGISLWADPNYRGAKSQSPTKLGWQQLSVADSELTYTYSLADINHYPFLQTDMNNGLCSLANQPQMLTASLFSWPSFAVSAGGDFAADTKVWLPSGTANSMQFAFWTKGADHPDSASGEIDGFESYKVGGSSTVNATSNLHGPLTEGGADTPVTLREDFEIPTARWVWFVIVKSGTTIEIWDDCASEGTLVKNTDYTDARVALLKHAHQIMLNAVVGQIWDATAFNAAHWPKQVKVQYCRAWVPPGTPVNAPLINLGEVNVTPGGSWTDTLPAASSIFSTGIAGTEEALGAYDGEDCPGALTAGANDDYLPGGMSVDLDTRAVTGTVPSTFGGSTALRLNYSFTGGGMAERAVRYYNVAPANKMPSNNIAVAPSTAVNIRFAYQQFHSGNLGPHTYHVAITSGGSWATISNNDTSEVTVSGTTGGAETVNLTVACANAIGQTTTENFSIVVATHTNLLSGNTDLANGTFWNFPNLTVTGSQTAPDGTSTAALLVDPAANNSHTFAQNGTISYVSGTQYTVQVYAKAVDAGLFQLTVPPTVGDNDVYANFNVFTGDVAAVGVSTKIKSTGCVDVGDGWFLCWLRVQAGATASAIGFQLQRLIDADAARLISYTGEAKGILIWRPRNEATATVPRVR